jgi:hypothetical protein
MGTWLAATTLLAEPAADPSPAAKLAEQQRRLATRYDDLEALLLKMAQVEGKQNPRRARLLVQAVELSRQQQTREQLLTIVAQLTDGRYSQALKGQASATEVLAELLKLLQTEDRAAERKSEQERLREYARELERLIRWQRSLQGQNEAEAESVPLAREQDQLRDRAAALADKIRRQEESSSERSNSAKPMNPPAAENPAAKPPPSSPMDPDGKSQEPSAEQPPPGNPVRQRVEAAQSHMQRARKNLEQAKREASQAEQQQARDSLEQAKAELERILRQLREEEREATLAGLETRFREMLAKQQKIFEATRMLGAVPAADRTPEHDIRSGQLAGEETKLTFDAEKALQLLQEEGSSIAFPATLAQTIDDMRSVAERLGKSQVDAFTQELQRDIIATLEEFLQALEQAREELEKERQAQSRGGESGSGGAPDEPLVNAIQELKLIRSLQLRVNTRTNRYAKLLQQPDDQVGQASNSELLTALGKLGTLEREVLAIVRQLLSKASQEAP